MTTENPTAALKPASLFRISDETSAFPGLDRVGTQFAAGLADVLGSHGAAGTKVICGDTSITTFEDWRDASTDLRAICRYRMAPLKGGMLLAVPQAYVTQLVDRYYGGD